MSSLRSLLLILSSSVALNAQLSIMPLPAHVEIAPGHLRIDSSFTVRLTGYTEPRLNRAVVRLVSRLGKQTGLSLTAGPPPANATLTISCEHAGAAVQTLGEDESYRLQITPSAANLSASQPLGVLRGIETFLQLVGPGPGGFAIPALTIDDHPRFPWRGLSYDVSRHFMPVDQVKRTLDGMAAVKLNVFHLHLSDNQGFRVESKIYPRLQKLGSGGLYYTQAQIRDIVAYARDRGIRVVPEIDLPGHATAILVAYPQLATQPAPQEVDHLYGVLDPVLDPTKPGVYVFLDRLIGEMAALFPDAYFHIGGDEVNGRLWRESAAITSFKQAHKLLPTPQDPDANQALQAMFNSRLEPILAKHGKHMEGWDEILAPALPKNIVIQSWRGQKSLADAARLGYRGILSSGYYLDLALPAAEHYLIDPLDAETGTLSQEEQKLILGGETAMWSEMVTPETMDSRVWPRAAVVAERFWSPREVRDVPDMYRRMYILSGQLEWLGLTHQSWKYTMLQRLAGPNDVEPLRTLGEAVEPVKHYDRERFGPYTTTSPFNQLVDAVSPESESCLRLSVLVSQALQTRNWNLVRAQLILWHENDARIGPILKDNELLPGIEILSRNTSELAAIGLDSIRAIEAGSKQTSEWKSRNLGRIKSLEEPSAALMPAFSGVIAVLVNSASD
jgi:hexosaminidase